MYAEPIKVGCEIDFPYTVDQIEYSYISTSVQCIENAHSLTVRRPIFSHDIHPMVGRFVRSLIPQRCISKGWSVVCFCFVFFFVMLLMEDGRMDHEVNFQIDARISVTTWWILIELLGMIDLACILSSIRIFSYKQNELKKKSASILYRWFGLNFKRKGKNDIIVLSTLLYSSRSTVILRDHNKHVALPLRPRFFPSFFS